jgi:hypothetical protein
MRVSTRLMQCDPSAYAVGIIVYCPRCRSGCCLDSGLSGTVSSAKLGQRVKRQIAVSRAVALDSGLSGTVSSAKLGQRVKRLFAVSRAVALASPSVFLPSGPKARHTIMPRPKGLGG